MSYRMCLSLVPDIRVYTGLCLGCQDGPCHTLYSFNRNHGSVFRVEMATKVKRQNENELTYNCHIKLHSLIPFNKMTPRVSIPHRFPRYTAPPSPSKPP